jgi:hypothetical protein
MLRYRVCMSTPFVEFRYMKPTYSSIPIAMHPKKPIELTMSAVAAPVANYDQSHGDSFTKM